MSDEEFTRWPKPRKRFEYLKLNDVSDKQLNELGADGWELLSMIDHPSKHIIPENALVDFPPPIPAFREFTFKREL